MDDAIDIIKNHIPSLTDKDEERIRLNIFQMAFEENDKDEADLAIRTCHCGLEIDGFYDYVGHLIAMLRKEAH